MIIHHRLEQGTVIIGLNGRMDCNSRKSFLEAIEQARKQGLDHVVLDMAGLSFIDSAGLGLISMTSDSLQPDHKYLSIIHPPDHVRDLLELTRVSHKVPYYGSLHEAVKAWPARKMSHPAQMTRAGS